MDNYSTSVLATIIARIFSSLFSNGVNTGSNLGDHETSVTEQLLPSSESKSNAIAERKAVVVTIPDADIVRERVIETIQNSHIITSLKVDEDHETSVTEQLVQSSDPISEVSFRFTDEFVEEFIVNLAARLGRPVNNVASEHGCNLGSTSAASKVVDNVLQQKRSRRRTKAKWIKHYCSSHKILLVGDGDFSFSACLAKAFGSASKMVATSLDSLDFLKENYPSATTHIGFLKNRGCTVIHNVDVTTMADHILLKHLKFDRIIYNFPLAGFFNESKTQRLKRNQRLVRLFMKNAKIMIEKDGEIHITHKTNAFYCEWNLENLAKQNCLRLIEDVEFKLSHYPGYNNKYGFGGNENFNCNPCSTYKFGPR